MSVEERVERIKAERQAESIRRGLLKHEREQEFTTHAKFINSRLEQLRELGVVGIIEEFTKSKVSPIFISEDHVELESTLPGSLRWPTAEEFRLSWQEAEERDRDFWSAQVLPPILNGRSLEWDKNLRIKISHYQSSKDHLMRSRFNNRPIAWIDLVWENKFNTLIVGGETETYRDEVTEVVIRDYSYYLDNIEEATARAVVNPKTEPPRIPHFDTHTPIGVQA